MARRRLSQQQRQRIRQAQQNEALSADHLQALVVSHQGGRVLLEFEQDDAVSTVDAKIKSNLGSIVCGDRVALEQGERDDYRVLAILPRANLLQRIDGFGNTRAVAANISQLVVCRAVVPAPNLVLLDQYLLSAEQQDIRPLIVLNKIDLLKHDSDPFQLESIYRPLGYDLVNTSVETGTGMDLLRDRLAGEVSVLGGVSGVGKSSLTRWLLPDEEIRIADISAANEEGRHTTRSSRLYHLPGGGDLIDTPGVRGFNPWIDRSLSPAQGFREIRELADDCRFHNCQHLHEPGCAVVTALGDGRLADSRYQSYLRSLEAADTRNDR